MIELLRIVSKRLFIISIIVNIIYSIATYGESYALAYFGTSPLTLEKITSLTIWISVLYVIMLIFNRIGSYIDNVNEFTSFYDKAFKYENL